MIPVLLSAVLLFVLTLTVSGQDCSTLQTIELGNTAALSSTGLLADALSVQTGDASLSYQLLRYNTVCLAQGIVRNTYRSTSLIVRFLDSGGNEGTRQLHLQCESGTWSINNFGSSQTAVSEANGNFTTALRRDCYLCIDPSMVPAGQVSTEEHCLACSSDCTGLMRCTGTVSLQTCCNFFDLTGSCAEACPANSSPNATTFDCECVPGFTLSENVCIQTDMCAPNPCQNGGSCIDLMNGFSCLCAAGYTSDTCETDIDDCESDPCQNGGSCTDMVNGFSCACTAGYTSDSCETDIDDCTSSPCENGSARCVDMVNGFSCECVSGFTTIDSSCEGPTVATNSPDDDDTIAIITSTLVCIVLIFILTSTAIAAARVYSTKKKRQKLTIQRPRSASAATPVYEEIGSVTYCVIPDSVSHVQTDTACEQTDNVLLEVNQAYGQAEVNQTSDNVALEVNQAYGQAEVNQTSDSVALEVNQAYGQTEVNQTSDSVALEVNQAYGQAEVNQTSDSVALEVNQAYGQTEVNQTSDGVALEVNQAYGQTT